ncbi:MAG TPA: sigma factor, partial [Acidimicrobiales bacterium]
MDEPTELQAGDDVVALAPVAPLAFTVFYRRELPQMVALAAAVAGHERAEDLAQEALLRAHREWDRIGRYDKPGAWTRRVLLNLATSSHRRLGSERRALARVA